MKVVLVKYSNEGSSIGISYMSGVDARRTTQCMKDNTMHEGQHNA